jgi:hypothetical protein
MLDEIRIIGHGAYGCFVRNGLALVRYSDSLLLQLKSRQIRPPPQFSGSRRQYRPAVPGFFGWAQKDVGGVLQQRMRFGRTPEGYDNKFSRPRIEPHTSVLCGLSLC